MITDSKIIELFYARDEQAIDKLAEKYGKVCHRVATNILKNESDAEECVNDAYLASWNTIPPENPDPLKTYLLRLVRNISTAKYHKNTSQKRNSHYDVALDELEECISTHACDLEKERRTRELALLIDGFLDTLDKDSRLMFMCRYWCSDSVSDIAEKFGITPHHVSVRLSRIREKMKKYLEKEGVEI